MDVLTTPLPTNLIKDQKHSKAPSKSLTKTVVQPSLNFHGRPPMRLSWWSSSLWMKLHWSFTGNLEQSNTAVLFVCFCNAVLDCGWIHLVRLETSSYKSIVNTFSIYTEHVGGNRAKGRISKWVLQENKARQVFRVGTCGHQGVKNSFFRKILCVLFSCYLCFEILPFGLLLPMCTPKSAAKTPANI